MRSSIRAQRPIARILVALLVGSLLLVPGQGVRAGEGAAASGRAYVEGVVLVGYRKDAPASARALARRSVQAEAHRRISPLGTDVERLTLPPGVSVADAVRELRGHAGVRFVEPDYIIRIDATSNDPGYVNNYLWGLYGPSTTPSSTYGSRAGTAWAAGHIGSDDVYVAVIDTGVEVDHPDLAPNAWTNPFEVAGNGLDDDGNGYADDVHGWDFFNDDASLFDSDSSDWHGTHVAGTIGAAGGNGTGVVGVNWAVTMIGVKFIEDEGSTSDAIAAIDYVTDLKVRHGLNIVAMNASWGGPEDSQALEDAINRGGDAGILFVAAAGNEGHDLEVEPSYPAAHTCTTEFDTGDPRGWDCLVSVAAIASNGTMPGFSNYGAVSVDLGAPGAEIWSTYPGGYYPLSGTSMATPHVTGALALLAACQAAPTPDALRSILLDSGVPTSSLAGATVTGDRLDVAAMTAECDTGIPPTATLTAPPDPVKAGPVDVTAWFSEPVTGLGTGDFSVGGTSSGWGVASVTGTGAGPYTVTLSAAAPTDGTLQLTLAADAVDGSTAPGPAAAVQSGSIKVDRIAPTSKAPSAAIRAGVSLSGSSIPIRVTWSGSDSAGGSGIDHFELSQSADGGATWSMVAANLTSTSNDLTVPASGKRRFRVRAVDVAGNVGPWAVGPIFKPRLMQESRAAIAYWGTWKRAASSGYSGGAVRWSKIAKNRATYTFTGRAIGFVTTLAPKRGQVKIRVDGVIVARLDLYSATWVSRRLVWQKTWASAGTHTIRIIVVGTSGRPRVDLDAFVVLK